MLCDNCGKKEANFHKRITINGVTKESHLCMHCASLGNPMGLIDYDVFDIMNDIFDFPGEEEMILCERCGNTYENFLKDGEIGCPSCYDNFKKTLNKLVEITDDKNEKKDNTIKEDESQRLRRLINEAVAIENYEEASRLKKELDKIKTKKEE